MDCPQNRGIKRARNTKVDVKVVRKCESCNVVDTKKCERCRNVWYCDKECQIKDWENHKFYCGGYEVIYSEAKKLLCKDPILLIIAFICNYVRLRKNEYLYCEITENLNTNKNRYYTIKTEVCKVVSEMVFNIGDCKILYRYISLPKYAGTIRRSVKLNDTFKNEGTAQMHQLFELKKHLNFSIKEIEDKCVNLRNGYFTASIRGLNNLKNDNLVDIISCIQDFKWKLKAI